VIPLHRVDPEAVVKFLVRAETRQLLNGIVRKKVSSAHVEDLVQETLRAALSAVYRTPPDREDARLIANRREPTPSK
jgi:DNA-directed RNA polymerase specialized sigma24 family protein